MSAQHTADLRALDQTRQRLQNLTNALGSLQREVAGSEMLPNWSSLQTSFALLSRQLATLTLHLTEQSATLTSLHAYPIPISTAVSVPGQGNVRVPVWYQQENVLTQLLRKKLDPESEEKMSRGLESRASHSAANGGGGGQRAAGEEGRTKDDMQQNLWTTAGTTARELAKAMPWAANFTLAERAGEGGIAAVDTGLRRNLAEDEDSSDDEDEDEDDDDDDDNDDGEPNESNTAGGMAGDDGNMDVDTKPVVMRPPMMGLEDVMRFVSTGVLVPRRVGPAGGVGGGIVMRG